MIIPSYHGRLGIAPSIVFGAQPGKVHDAVRQSALPPRLQLLAWKGDAMSQADLCWLPATEMAAAIRARQLSPIELLDALLDRIHQYNPTLNAYCTLAEEAARQAALSAEAAVLRGDDLGVLHGVPVSVKDLLFTSGVRTMRGSRIYEQFVPEFTFPFNMTGQPAITVPCGVGADGMPVGLQIIGRRFADATVLQAAAAFEAARPWADRTPSFV